VLAYLEEFARVVRPTGEAFVQLPVLESGAKARAWRALRTALVPLTAFRGPTSGAAFRGTRLTQPEIDDGLARAGLRVTATDTGPDAPYRYAHDLFLRLVRA